MLLLRILNHVYILTMLLLHNYMILIPYFARLMYGRNQSMTRSIGSSLWSLAVKLAYTITWQPLTCNACEYLVLWRLPWDIIYKCHLRRHFSASAFEWATLRMFEKSANVTFHFYFCNFSYWCLWLNLLHGSNSYHIRVDLISHLFVVASSRCYSIWDLLGWRQCTIL